MKKEKSDAYRFSFTAASLQVPVMISLAEKMVREKLTLAELKPENIGKERAITNKRQFREMKARLATLSDNEVTYLVDGTYEEQRLLSMIAFARTYRFFYDFVTDVVARKVTLFDYTLTDMDYNVFFNRIVIDHPEAERLTTLTQKKVKQNTFKVLEQAGIINNVKERIIRVPQVSVAFSSLISATRPQDLKLILI
jgi:Putative inner membrane protein (DUF1819).